MKALFSIYAFLKCLLRIRERRIMMFRVLKQRSNGPAGIVILGDVLKSFKDTNDFFFDIAKFFVVLDLKIVIFFTFFIILYEMLQIRLDFAVS